MTSMGDLNLSEDYELKKIRQLVFSYGRLSLAQVNIAHLNP